MISKLVRIAEDFSMPKKAFVVDRSYVLNLILTEDDYLVEENKDKSVKAPALVGMARRTSGISPSLGSDQIQYVFPGFSETGNKHNDAYMKLLDLFCEKSGNKFLIKLREALKDISVILNTKEEYLNPIKREQRDIIESLGVKSKGGFVNIRVGKEPITNYISDIWEEYQKELVKSSNRMQSCSVCAKINYIPDTVPEPLNKFYSSNNPCSWQYDNQDSSICIDCALKANSVLNNTYVRGINIGTGASATKYIVRHLSSSDDREIVNIDNFSPYVNGLKSKKDLESKPENIEYMLVTENNMGRSTYFEMDIIDNIYRFFSDQEDYLPSGAEKYYSINDLSKFFGNSDKSTARGMAKKVFFKYAISRQLKGKSWIINEIIHQMENLYLSKKPLDIHMLRVILNITGVNMSDNKSVKTMGRLLANMSRVQAVKDVKSTFTARYAHRLTKDPTLIGVVVGEFIQKYGKDYEIYVQNWQEDIKDLPNRRLTNGEILAFYVAIEEEVQRLLGESKKRKEEKERKESENNRTSQE